jgi:hypothetical protein
MAMVFGVIDSGNTGFIAATAVNLGTAVRGCGLNPKEVGEVVL